MTASKNPTQPVRDVIGTTTEVAINRSNGRGGKVEFHIFTLSCQHKVRGYASQGFRTKIRCKECPALNPLV